MHRLVRIRVVDDEPISLHTLYVPTSLAADLPENDLVNRSCASSWRPSTDCG